ncbi:MAG: FtsW/RodA/SpoVE family cell cycle protein, partial [Enterovibrio sp.]
MRISLPRWLQDPDTTPSVLYDRKILWIALSLMLIGLVMVSSASITEATRLGGQSYGFVVRHSIYLVISLGAAMATLFVPLTRWQQMSWFLLCMVLVLLVAVLLIG